MFSRRNLSLAAGMAAAVALTAGALIASTADASPVVAPGAPAPAFTGTDSNGAAVSLSDFAGKTVVLEWTNDGCPFVQKHYTAPPADDVVWLSIASSGPGKQGHVTGDEANALTTSRGASPAHVLLDPAGTLGHLYGAKTTPHMFVIRPDGTLAYQGAIDSKPSARVADIDGATNYVRAALASVAAGEPVAVPSAKPYGCSVKYE
jgi:hypothetical protein